MQGLQQDFRQAVRGLMRAPGFTAAALLVLAIGTGANTAVYSALDALLLRALPYPQADRLVALHETRKDGQPQPVALRAFLDWQASAQSFSAMAAYRPRTFGLRRGAETPVVVSIGMTTHDLFATLGVDLLQGRGFTAQEETEAQPVIVLNHQLWQRQGQPALGARLLINEVPHTLLGVLPPGFSLPMGGQMPEAFVPLSHKDYGVSHGQRALEAVARLKPDTTAEAAHAELRTLAAGLSLAHPDTNAETGAGLRSLQEALRGQNRRPLTLLMAASLLLLLIACSSIANLLVARAAARQREIAIRAALGASFARLLRGFLLEGLLLGGLGSALGLGLAALGIGLLPVALELLGGKTLETLQLNTPALLFTLGAALACSLVFGLAPALLARRTDLERSLRDRGAVSGARLRAVLLLGQIASSLILLLGAGLLLRSFFQLLAVHPGFDTTSVQRFGLGLPEVRYDSEQKMAGFHTRLLQQLRQIPGVETVGAAFRVPLTALPRASFQLEGVQLEAAQRPRVELNLISPGYLETLQVPLLQGRALTDQDTLDAPRVLLVNQALAHGFWPDRNPVGQRLTLNWTSDKNPAGTVWEVVGVAGNLLSRSLDQPPQPELLLPLLQFPPEGASYVLRGSVTPQQAAQAVRGIDPDLESVELRPLADLLDENLADRRTGLGLTLAFAGVALLLTLAGVQGLVAFHVIQRRREFGIRMALGAQSSQVMRLVLGQGLRLAAGGIVLGLLGAVSFSQVLGSQLYGISPWDPLTYGLVALGLGLAALLACLRPAWKAASTEPRSVLQEI